MNAICHSTASFGASLWAGAMVCVLSLVGFSARCRADENAAAARFHERVEPILENVLLWLPR